MLITIETGPTDATMSLNNVSLPAKVVNEKPNSTRNLLSTLGWNFECCVYVSF